MRSKNSNANRISSTAWSKRCRLEMTKILFRTWIRKLNEDEPFQRSADGLFRRP
jgi:hypothetical protein